MLEKVDAILVDFDGTLILADEQPNQPVIDLLRWLWRVNDEVRILIVTGRLDDTLASGRTMNEWLDEHGVMHNTVMLRAPGDISFDVDVKRNMYLDFIQHSFNVVFVLEDRDKAVNMWRDLGLACFQVRPELR